MASLSYYCCKRKRMDVETFIPRILPRKPVCWSGLLVNDYERLLDAQLTVKKRTSTDPFIRDCSRIPVLFTDTMDGQIQKCTGELCFESPSEEPKIVCNGEQYSPIRGKSRSSAMGQRQKPQRTIYKDNGAIVLF